MSEVVKWDGFPVFGRDRDAWHLLRFENEEHPTPMWWDWRLEVWFTDPSARGGMRAEAAHETGFSYLAGTVTPSDLNETIAEAVAVERERILRTHNISTEDDLFWYFDDREYGHNEASELLQANEFEIVHIATGRNTGELFGFSANHEDHFFKTEAEAVAAIEAIQSAAK